MKNRRGLLQLEGLTERIVPAVSIRAVDGDLVISGIANTVATKQHLEITVTGNNQVNITDGTTVRGVYAVTGDLKLNLSNRNDEVTINFTGDFSLDGSIIANLNNGNDTIAITNSGGVGEIFGDVIVDGGNGNDSLTINNTGATGDDLIVSGQVTFNGGSGVDIFNLNNTTTTGTQDLFVGNGLTLTRVNTVNIGTGATEAVNISGNVTINSSADKIITNTTIIGGSAVSISGALVVTGGQGTDLITLDTVTIVDVVPAEDTVLEIVMSLDRGSNTLTVTDSEFGASGTDADFSYTGTTGIDTINFNGGGNSVSGNATFALGNGANSYTGDSAGNQFDSDVTITGGNNNDDIDFDGDIVGGLLTVNIGKSDSVTGNSFNSNGLLGGGLTYIGSNGIDTVTLTDGDNLRGDVSIDVGAGLDSITISGTTTVSATSLIVNLGNDGNMDTLIYDNEFDSLITILNQGSGSTPDNVSSV
jgi:hypothetical protein